MIYYDAPIDKIQHNPWQTRPIDPEHVANLAASIAAQGLLQPPVARLVIIRDNIPHQVDPALYGGLKTCLHDEPDAVLQLALGHHRLEAVRLLHDQGKTNGHIALDIRALRDDHMAIIAWTENEDRRDVSPIERANAIQRRMTDFGWTQTQVADKLGIARPTVANILRLLKLPEHIQAALADGRISARVATALLPMYDLPAEILAKANAASWHRPIDIERQALGGASSDIIRQQVEGVLRSYTTQLQNSEFGLDDMFTEGTMCGYESEGGKVYCAVCRTCDRRLKDHGNLCLDLGCYTTKTAFSRQRYLSKAADTCNIPPVDPTKGGSVTELPYLAEERKKILDIKCPNLRLEYCATSLGNDDTKYVPGYPHARFVCDKRNNSCSCASGLKIVEQSAAEQPVEQLNAEHLSELARQARQARKDLPAATEKFKRQIQDQAEQWLRNDDPAAFWLLANGYVYARVKDPTDLDGAYKALAEKIANIVLYIDAGDKQSLYDVTNRHLRERSLPQVDPADGLVTVFACEQPEVQGFPTL